MNLARPTSTRSFVSSACFDELFSQMKGGKEGREEWSKGREENGESERLVERAREFAKTLAFVLRFMHANVLMFAMVILCFGTQTTSLF